MKGELEGFDDYNSGLDAYSSRQTDFDDFKPKRKFFSKKILGFFLILIVAVFLFYFFSSSDLNSSSGFVSLPFSESFGDLETVASESGESIVNSISSFFNASSGKDVAVEKEISFDRPVEFLASLDSASLEFNVAPVDVFILGSAFVNLGDQEFRFSDGLVLYNFSGKISFSSSAYVFDGVFDKLSSNGFEFFPGADDSVSVSSSASFYSARTQIPIVKVVSSGSVSINDFGNISFSDKPLLLDNFDGKISFSSSVSSSKVYPNSISSDSNSSSLVYNSDYSNSDYSNSYNSNSSSSSSGIVVFEGLCESVVFDNKRFVVSAK